MSLYEVVGSIEERKTDSETCSYLARLQSRLVSTRPVIFLREVYYYLQASSTERVA